METGLYRPDTSYISQITYFRLEFEGVLPKPAAKLTSTHQREGVMSNVPQLPPFKLLSFFQNGSDCLDFVVNKQLGNISYHCIVHMCTLHS